MHRDELGSPQRRSIVAAVACCLALLCGSTSSAQVSNLVGSDCNVIQQNLKIGDNSTVIVENDCGAPDDSFRVRYIWLDEISASFVSARYFDKNLSQLFGSAPKVYENDVFRKVSDLVQRFGTADLQSLDRGLNANIRDKRGEMLVNVVNRLDGIPVNVLRRLKIYWGGQSIIWPDVQALRVLGSSKEWPRNYAMTYLTETEKDLSPSSFRRDRQAAEHAAIECVLLHGTVKKDQIDSYWDAVQALETAAEKGELKDEHVHYSSSTWKGSVADNPSLQAMSYFAEYGWPEDFLIVTGDIQANDCSSEGGQQLSAVPRRLFLLVAVVEARSRFLEIESMRFGLDPDESIRALQPATQDVNSPAGSISLKRNESVVIPLRIELRYDLSDPRILALTSDADAKRIHRKIQAAPVESFKFRLWNDAGERTRTAFEKTKSAFRPPETRRITQTYVFGKSYELRQVSIKGNLVSVRAAPPSALVMNSDHGEGSCPFLFAEDASGEPAFLQRVLVGASRADLARSETVRLPAGTRAITLSEIEPEITFLDKVSVASSETGAEIVLAEKLRIRPRSSVRFEIPPEFQDHPLLKVEGYYRPLGQVQALAAPRP